MDGKLPRASLDQETGVLTLKGSQGCAPLERLSDEPMGGVKGVSEKGLGFGDRYGSLSSLNNAITGFLKENVSAVERVLDRREKEGGFGGGRGGLGSGLGSKRLGKSRGSSGMQF